jgi:hypothetical protein
MGDKFERKFKLFSGCAERNHDKPKLGQLICQSKFELVFLNTTEKLTNRANLLCVLLSHIRDC